MKEHIAAQPEIGLRQRFLDDIHPAKLMRRIAALLAQLLDQGRDDVAADVARARRELYMPHPVEIAARSIEQHADLQLVETARQGGAQRLGVVKRAALSASALARTP